MRYDAVFLDIDGTLLWVDLDVEGYVSALSPYTTDGPLTVEKATGPVWKGLKTHIRENINYATEEELARFRRENAENTARTLGLDAPTDLLVEVAGRCTVFNPYCESEAVLEELRSIGVPLYALSNWDIGLEGVLEELGWRRFFDDLVVSAIVGAEKPEGTIFEEALRVAGVEGHRAVHVGNDPVSDVRGAARAGIDAVLVDRRGGVEAPEATAVLPDLRGLPRFVRG
ncbi:HAD hydrolase-like protein [Rubrobacter marinus]|uniref:HAD hydrolase-like protein n=1 Tax=Rubrobacter marinus TaxID=2653852 RepID=A0A6G8PY93_9ACTN|nr:HAD family hydrolase [Rubrobacter marinus]QIN79160.1 HAD hydrolase-like protein [Rubrobacter marinus]